MLSLIMLLAVGTPNTIEATVHCQLNPDGRLERCQVVADRPPVGVEACVLQQVRSLEDLPDSWRGRVPAERDRPAVVRFGIRIERSCADPKRPLAS